MSDIHSRLRMTDILAWPEVLQGIAWEMPWQSLPLQMDPETGSLCVVSDYPETAPIDLFPKLAIKSWQESGRLRLIPCELSLQQAIAARLATPTPQQRTILSAWKNAEVPAFLHLFAWHDMTTVSETRCQWSSGTLRTTSMCQRNGVRLEGIDFTQVGELIAKTMPQLGNFVVQFAVAQDGRTSVVDINPVVTADEADALKAAAIQDDES